MVVFAVFVGIILFATLFMKKDSLSSIRASYISRS